MQGQQKSRTGSSLCLLGAGLFVALPAKLLHSGLKPEQANENLISSYGKMRAAGRATSEGSPVEFSLALALEPVSPLLGTAAKITVTTRCGGTFL